jgi:xanthine/CO dehydrogenase XdhC/CoxF family maturation factor
LKELKTIVDTFAQVDFSERKAALATVMQVKGSSYRSPGARMLMLDNGRWVGSVSGGCLEGDALRKARSVMADGVPKTVTYDTSEDQELGIGLGCNGIIDILLEPIDPTEPHNPIAFVQSLLAIDDTTALATVFEAEEGAIVQVGEKVLLDPEGKVEGPCTRLNELLKDKLEVAIQTQKSHIYDLIVEGFTVKVFVEVIQPAIDLLIFGGGFDAKPVAELASLLGWNVRVSDECVAHLVPINFPNANELVSCQKEYIKRDIKITPFTAIVLMSHNFIYDKEVLAQVIDSKAHYIGILGPKKRGDKMLKALLDEHHLSPTKEQLERLHYPIGLDIGAETPDEIAVSIIGEIQARFANRSGGFLKYRTGAIHHRDGKEDQVFRQVYLKHMFEKREVN